MTTFFRTTTGSAAASFHPAANDALVWFTGRPIECHIRGVCTLKREMGSDAIGPDRVDVTCVVLLLYHHGKICFGEFMPDRLQITVPQSEAKWW